MSTLTTGYTRLHEAFSVVAESEGLTPFDVRVLLALSDLGGDANTLELERELGCDGSAIRRSMIALRKSQHVVASASDGREPRPGVRSHLTLSARGKKACDVLHAEVRS